MRHHKVLAAVMAAFASAPGAAAAQHGGHQTGAPRMSAQCEQAQPAVENIIAAAMMRLESARQSNDSLKMRAAVDYLEGALRDIRTQLAPCVTAGGAADPQAGHAMPETAPRAEGKAPAATTSAPKAPAAAPDPHAGHQMAKPAPTKRAPDSKTSPSRPERASKPEPHADKAPPASKKEMDPVNGLMVDPSTAPKATHQGTTYYFSSEQSRKEFLQNPAKFAKKPKG
jgi:YHS domain-containing protein